jgi:geranylgeranyl pyrophosphate synthase
MKPKSYCNSIRTHSLHSDLGGKRIRPVLTFNDRNFNADYKKSIKPAALAVEVFHNFFSA